MSYVNAYKIVSLILGYCILFSTRFWFYLHIKFDFSTYPDDDDNNIRIFLLVKLTKCMIKTAVLSVTVRPYAVCHIFLLI